MNIVTCAHQFQVSLFNSVSCYLAVLFFQLLKVHWTWASNIPRHYLFQNKSCIFIFLISANGTNHLIHTFPRSCPCCFLSSYLIQPILPFWCLPMCQSGIWATSKRNLANGNHLKEYQWFIEQARGYGAGSPSRRRVRFLLLCPTSTAMLSPSTHSPFKSQSPRRQGHVCQTQVSCPILPSHSCHLVAKGRTWPFLIPPRETERWTLTH